MESRVSIGWRAASPLDGEVGSPLDGEPRLHWMETRDSIVWMVTGLLGDDFFPLLMVLA